MTNLAPPQPPDAPPRVAQADDDGLRRLRFRIWQVSICILTILITAFFVRLGPLPAILAIVVAKHVLVAVLIMGNDVYPARRSDP
jgi:hypothetical protein